MSAIWSVNLVMEYLQTQFSHFFSSSWNPSCHPFQHQQIKMLLPILFCRWIWGVILIWLLLNVVYCTRDESKETFGAFYPWFGRGGTAPRLSSLPLLQLKISLHPIIQWPPQFQSIHGLILIQSQCQEHRPIRFWANIIRAKERRYLSTSFLLLAAISCGSISFASWFPLWYEKGLLEGLII